MDWLLQGKTRDKSRAVREVWFGWGGVVEWWFLGEGLFGGCHTTPCVLAFDLCSKG